MSCEGDGAPTRQNIKSHLQKYRLMMQKRARLAGDGPAGTATGGGAGASETGGGAGGGGSPPNKRGKIDDAARSDPKPASALPPSDGAARATALPPAVSQGPIPAQGVVSAGGPPPPGASQSVQNAHMLAQQQQLQRRLHQHLALQEQQEAQQQRRRRQQAAAAAQKASGAAPKGGGDLEAHLARQELNLKARDRDRDRDRARDLAGATSRGEASQRDISA